MSRWCWWHDGTVPDDQAVQVGAGLTAYACRPCVVVHGLMDVAEHPPGATGIPLTVDRRYIGRRSAPPIAPGRPA